MNGDFVTIKRIVIKTTSPGVRRRLLFARDKFLDYHARWRHMNGWGGSLPDFLIVGTQKGGTTELYDQLTRHPRVMASLTKEVHFFDVNYHRGLGWYSTFFPARAVSQCDPPEQCVTGEASPCYIFHPSTARRVRATIPHVKIIMLLRDPVNRAYSHYHHEVRLGYETRPFEDAIVEEPVRLRGEKEKMLANDEYYSESYMHYSYLSRGIYVDQVKTWREHFPEAQLLVLQSEDFFADMSGTLRQVYDFLGVAHMEPAKLRPHRAFPYPKLDKGTRQYLYEYFRPYNQQLCDYLGRTFSWS